MGGGGSTVTKRDRGIHVHNKVVTHFPPVNSTEYYGTTGDTGACFVCRKVAAGDHREIYRRVRSVRPHHGSPHPVFHARSTRYIDEYLYKRNALVVSQTPPSHWSNLARYRFLSNFSPLPPFYFRFLIFITRRIKRKLAHLSNLHSLYKLSGDSSYRESYRETWPGLSLGKGIRPISFTTDVSGDWDNSSLLSTCCNQKLFFLLWDSVNWRSLDGDRMYIRVCIWQLVLSWWLILKEKWMGVK